MENYERLLLAIALVTFALTGCENQTRGSGSAVASSVNKKPVAAADAGRVQITAEEAKNLGIEFVEVTQTGDRILAPYNALLYDASGREWVYVSPEPNVFRRAEIKVDAIEGDTMYLAKAPATGTKLVTNGATELYGIELGVGK